MLISNFASGELSENLNGRVDLPQYYQGASRVSNFDVIPTGGIRRRAGIKRISQLSGNCRLIPFILDPSTNFVLEFVPHRIYLWRNGEKVIDAMQAQVYIETDYESLADINELHFAQNYNELVFVHPDYRPFMLRYDITENTMSGGNMDFNFLPQVECDDAYDYIVIAGENLPVRSIRADDQLAFVDYKNEIILTGEKGYCIYKNKLYEYNRDATRWEQYSGNIQTETELFTTARKYPSCVTFFNSRLWFAGTKEKRQKVWASATPDTDGTRYNDFATYQTYVTVSRVVKDADVHIFTGDIYVSNIDTENHTTTIINLTQDLTVDGLLQEDITSYFISNDSYIPIGTKVLSITENTITIDADLTDIIKGDKKRVVFTIQLWRNIENASADDYEFRVTVNNVTTSDCSFNFEIASDQNDAIKFIAANKYLTIGTESSLWNIPADVTAVSIMAEMAGRYGSDHIQGHAIGTAMCFLAQGKYGIRETYYDSNQEAFITNNIALLAEQMLTESPAVEFDFMTNPYNRLVLTRDDGKIAVMLYDKTNGVAAWSRIEHGGDKRFESCAVVCGQRQSDIMYLSVKDGDDYFLEMFDENGTVFLDGWQPYSVEVAGLYSAGAVVYNETQDTVTELSSFDSESINEGDTVYIGYPYESLISSMPVLTNDPTGKKRITTLLVRFCNSYMPVVQCDSTEEYFTDVEEPYSGIKAIDFAGNTDRDVKFTLKTDRPYPCKVLSINAQTA